MAMILARYYSAIVKIPSDWLAVASLCNSQVIRMVYGFMNYQNMKSLDV